MEQPDRPNVVLIMADQWRGDCLGVAGHPVVRTPFLDRLAASGARFDRAYSATPTCIPARASLLTGLRPEHHGRVGYRDHVPWDYETTLAGEFTRAGYQTHAVGKMHVYPERSQLGFQHVELHSPLGIVRMARQQGLDPDLVDDYLPWLRERLGRNATFFEHGLDSNSYVARPWDKPEHTHPSAWVASRSSDFLRRRDPRKPFFLFASFNAPHPPYDPPAWAYEQYLDAPMPAPPIGDWVAELEPYRRSADPAAQVAGPVPADVLQRARAGYYGQISHVDQQVSAILESLDQYGVRQNTIVCFLSDHGEMLGDHHCYRKGMPYEGSARIPLLLAGPGIRPGTTSDALVELGDVMPTLLDLAGLPVPDCVDGSSARGLVDGGSTPWRDVLHGEHLLFGQSLQWITDQRYKYVWFSGTGGEQLFDLVSDPGEEHDLVGRAEHAAELTRLRGVLVERLRGREEGFVETDQLVTGRPVHPLLGELRRRYP